MKTFAAVLFAVLVCFTSTAGAITDKQQQRIEQLHKTGLELLNRMQYNQAIPVFREILSIDPKDKTAARYLMIAQQQTVELSCKQAASAYEEGNYKKALSLWGEILTTYPGDQRVAQLIAMTNSLAAANALEARYVAAEKLIKEKEYGRAVKELEAILSQKPQDERALALMSAARKGLAEEEIKKHYELAAAYVKADKYDLAIEEWRKVLELDNKQEAALRFIAKAGQEKMAAEYAEAKELYEAGDYAASRDLYDQILASNPTDVDVETIIDRLKKVMLVVKKIEATGTAWEIVKKALSNDIAVHGNIKAAIAAVRYAEQLVPENALIGQIRDFIEREHLAVVRTMEPPSKNTNIIDQYLAAALNHIYEGRFDLAIEECDIVLILQPQNILALKRLGSAQFATGNKGKALDAWSRALKLSPNDEELKKFIGKSR